MSRRIGKARRRMLLAFATGTVCLTCRGAPGGKEEECGPRRVKRIDYTCDSDDVPFRAVHMEGE